MLGVCFQGKTARFVVASLIGVSCWLSMLHDGSGSQETTKSKSGLGQQGNVQAGRDVFNGKGVCHYCHGIDGRRDRPPQLAPDTTVLIAGLDPPPADLRNPKTLRLKSDKARAKTIKQGHRGTGMFPTTTLTDQELTDTLAYLAALRTEGHQSGHPDSSGVQRDSEPKASARNSRRGEELYRASCVVCHGSRAMGGVGPRLAGNPVLSDDNAFWETVHQGRHVMPPLKGVVTDPQLADIRTWLQTLP